MLAVSTKKDIRALSLNDLKVWMDEQGEKSFRAKQIYEWLWQKSARSFDEMTNLSKPLRDKLAAHFDVKAIQVEDKQVSSDRTIKSAFKLFDGNVVEGVFLIGQYCTTEVDTPASLPTTVVDPIPTPLVD